MPFAAAWWVQSSGYELRTDLNPSGVTLNPDLDWSLVVGGKMIAKLHQPGWQDELHVQQAGKWLTLCTDESGKSAPRGSSYDPLQNVGLHRLFADLRSETAILEFAHEYGLLGREISKLRPHSQHLKNLQGQPLDQEDFYWGEALDTWYEEIGCMRILLALHEALQSKSPLIEEIVRSLVDIDPRGILQVGTGYADALQGATHVPLRMKIPVLAHRLDVCSGMESWNELARMWFEAQINRCLAEGTRPAIEARAGAPVYILPRDLLGAIHIMLAEEITGQAGNTIKCHACGKYFFPEHGRQIYCDDRCKFKAYRQRKKETSNGK